MSTCKEGSEALAAKLWTGSPVGARMRTRQGDHRCGLCCTVTGQATRLRPRTAKSAIIDQG